MVWDEVPEETVPSGEAESGRDGGGLGRSLAQSLMSSISQEGGEDLEPQCGKLREGEPLFLETLGSPFSSGEVGLEFQAPWTGAPMRLNLELCFRSGGE